MAPLIDTKYNTAFKSVLKSQVAEKARKDKGKGKAHHHNLDKGCSLQGTLQCLYSSFPWWGRSRGCSGHYQDCDSQHQGNRSRAQGTRTTKWPDSCKSCGMFSHWAQDSKMNPQRILPLLCQSKSHQHRRIPSNTRLSSAVSSCIRRKRYWQRLTAAAATHSAKRPW
jgi:hypothetical protein